MSSTEGANALKLETEVEIEENKKMEDLNTSENLNIPIENIGYLEGNETNDHLDQKTEQTNHIHSTSIENSNEEEAPRLFTEDESTSSSKEEEPEENANVFSDTLLDQVNDNDEEEDYEIPAFLRKQKN